MHELTARILFDDRVNNKASIHDLDLGLIQAYLQEIKSDLYAESTRMPWADLCRSMHIAKGSDEDLRPVNVGLLFFSKEPELFFPRTWIELVWHQEISEKKFKEHYFKGPLQKQLRDALSFLETNIISEQVLKLAEKAEAERFYNFPYNAVEEALSNAVYHKSYELGAPIEVQVWPDKIEILSYPGPVPPVNAEILQSHKRIVARDYRNRRIGDFLKELHLTEGRGTGFPTIYRAMESNGSPSPNFDTDNNSNYFLVTIPAHSLTTNAATNQDKKLTIKNLEELIALTNQATNQARTILINAVHDKVGDILGVLSDWTRRTTIFKQIALSNQTFNRERYLDPLIKWGWVMMEFPEKKTNPNQRYRITESGKKLLNLITQND